MLFKKLLYNQYIAFYSYNTYTRLYVLLFPRDVAMHVNLQGIEESYDAKEPAATEKGEYGEG